MVGVAEVAAAATVLTQARGFLCELQQGQLSERHQGLVTQALDFVGDAQDRLSHVQARIIELQDENRALNDKLRAVENWQARREQYEFVKAAAGGIVLQSSTAADFDHYACPTCAETKEQIHPLQPAGKYSGNLQCPGCEKYYSIEPSRPLPGINYGPRRPGP